MERIIAANSNCYHGFTLDEAIEGIKNAGFHYIELTATKGWTEHVFPTMSIDSLFTVKEKLKKADLIPFAMSGHTNLMDNHRLPDFISNIRLASFFKCDYIVSSIGEAHMKDKAVASNEVAAENIRSLLPYLEEYDLVLVLENHGEHATGKIIKEIVDLVDSPRALVNYDTANVIYFAGVDPLDDIPTCIEKIGFMHFKDKIGGPREWNFPGLGKGQVDFPEIIKLLNQEGNLCPLSIEIEFTDDGPKDLNEVNQALKDSFDYLNQIELKG